MVRRGRQRQREQAPETPPQQEEHACSRGDFCQEGKVTYDGGKRTVTPALTYRAFCETDRAEIVSALAAFPRQYDQLQADLHTIRSAGQVPGAAFGSRLPLYGDVDAAARRLHLVLTSWEDRIREVPRIDAPASAGIIAPATPREQVRVAAAVLHRNVDAMLTLEPAWMIRYAPAGRIRDHMRTAMPAEHALDYWDERRSTLVDVELRIYDELDGARAGLELLHLQHVCRRILGEIERKPDLLVGVACYRCGHKALRRADPPAADDDPLYYSECRVCGHQMTEGGYREHVKRLAALVGGARRITPRLQLPDRCRGHADSLVRVVRPAVLYE